MTADTTDTLAKYVVLGIFLILALVAIQYIFRNQLGMIEGLANRKSNKGGLSPNTPYSPAPAALVQMMDASRDNPPFNNQMYAGFDPLNFNMGDYTPQDAAFREKELTMKYSDNPMDANWGGIRYSESAVASGIYADRTRPDAARSDTSALVPMKVPAASEKYRSARYAGDAVSRGRGKDVEWGKMRKPAA